MRLNAAQVGGYQGSPRSLLQYRQGRTRGWGIVYAAYRDGVVFLFLVNQLPAVLQVYFTMVMGGIRSLMALTGFIPDATIQPRQQVRLGDLAPPCGQL
jgi:hypothetical protein